MQATNRVALRTICINCKLKAPWNPKTDRILFYTSILYTSFYGTIASQLNMFTFVVIGRRQHTQINIIKVVSIYTNCKYMRFSCARIKNDFVYAKYENPFELWNI